jgi:hypothetical protein
VAACRRFDVYATLQTNPSYTCFIATSTYAYGSFIGNVSSWTHVSSWSGSYYNLTAPTWNAWSNAAACSTAYTALCEIPVAVFACNSTPPPAPAPPPAASLCE